MNKKFKIFTSVIFSLILWSNLTFAGWLSDLWNAKSVNEKSITLQIESEIDSDRCFGLVSGMNSSLLVWNMIDDMKWLKWRIKNIGSYAREMTPELEDLVTQYKDVRCAFLVVEDDSCKVNEVGCAKDNIANLVKEIEALEAKYNIQFGKGK